MFITVYFSNEYQEDIILENEHICTISYVQQINLIDIKNNITFSFQFPILSKYCFVFLVLDYDSFM